MTTSQLTWAAGFQLKEQSASLQGLSFAGATAKASDASTIFFNPAGMTRLSHTEAYGNLSLIKPTAKFKAESVTAATGGGGAFPVSSDSNGGDAGALSAVPAVYGMTTLDNGVRLGLSVNTPFGLSTEYSDDWVGRYYALKSELLTINVSPNIAFKVNDKLSLGFGGEFQYIQAELTNSINVDSILGGGASDGFSRLKGDDIGFGFRLGGLYEFNEDTRVGISYKSRIRHTLEGDIKIENVGALAGNALFKNADVTANIQTPDVLSIGAFHSINPQWSVLADASWTNWSVFKDLHVVNSDGGLVRQNVEENWKDSYFVSTGVEYHPCNCTNKTYQFGIAYDKTAIKDEYRTFRIPGEDRYWLSAGYLYDWGKDKSLGIGYSHIFVDEAKVTENSSAANKGVISGNYDSSVDILSVNLSMKF
tara:strand:+ start:3982 stop:5244 length:1263 start_codon:yes stop_codon:yes gene_type:complete